MTKMKYHVVTVLCLQIATTFSAPLQMQWQSQMSVQPTQEELLQQQLVALQQLQMMNDWGNNVYPPMQKMVTPMMIIMPGPQLNQINLGSTNNDIKNHDVKDKVTVNEDLDSVVVEAETTTEPKPEYNPQKAVLLFPNRGRFALGGLISAIPFLPIEINVPDTISWIYNGIAGIIGGIGQNFPFNRPPPTEMPQENLRMILKRLQNRNQNQQSPILVLPDVAQMYNMN